jgi:hypothetical protein
LGSGILDATASTSGSSLAGAFAYTSIINGGSPQAVTQATVLGAGSYVLTATFTPTDTTDYTTATGTATITVNQAKPSISWAIPADVTFGTGLSATQLNASSSVAGKFAYSPIAGTVFPAGTHTLVVTFTPADATDYATATQSVQLKVNKAQLSVTANNLNMVYGAAIPRLTFIISGFVHGDTLNSSVTGAPGITTSATSKSAVGTYLARIIREA